MRGELDLYPNFKEAKISLRVYPGTPLNTHNLVAIGERIRRFSFVSLGGSTIARK
jgi:hypothetical protein